MLLIVRFSYFIFYVLIRGCKLQLGNATFSGYVMRTKAAFIICVRGLSSDLFRVVFLQIYPFYCDDAFIPTNIILTRLLHVL